MPARLRSNPIHPPNKHYLLDFQSLEELPDSFKWAHLDSPNRVLESESESESVPVIDLNDPNAQQLIGLACKSWGVFQVINHGVSKSLLDKIEACGKNLFALPVQQKLKAVRSPDGVTGYGPARISSFFSKRMWSEGFTIVGSPLEHARQLWPNDYTTFWYVSSFSPTNTCNIC
uniref:Gibberellin 3-beta-dioxygenase n=1 Tax=Opuntia streptacantha TaxID=393608 RepID=A0A7C9EV11_OPUST